MDKVKLAVIYYSATGTTYQLAKGLRDGAKDAGAEVRLCKVKELAPEEAIASNEGWSQHRLETQDVPEATLDDLRWADAIILGAPTRYGLPAAQLKQFIDSTGPLWDNGELVNKIVLSFTSAATLHGGHETTLTALNNTESVYILNTSKPFLWQLSRFWCVKRTLPKANLLFGLGITPVSKPFTQSSSSNDMVKTSLTIMKSPEELYSYWRKLENLPRIMSHLETVVETDSTHSHWVAKAPVLGAKASWDAEITEDIPNKKIAWHSLPGSQVPNAGSVEFIELAQGRGTLLNVNISYTPPAGPVGAIAAKILGDAPDEVVKSDLRRFRQVMEAGEVVSAASSHG